MTYVKLYLVKNRKCLAKAKTTLSNKKTLNPLFQQQLTFHEDYHGCILQVRQTDSMQINSSVIYVYNPNMIVNDISHNVIYYDQSYIIIIITITLIADITEYCLGKFW